MGYCSSCAAPLSEKAGYCARCGTAVVQAPRPATAGVTSFIRASGRIKTAGMWIALGGLAIVLSAFLPWVSAIGIITVSLTGGGVVYVFVLGGILIFIGVRILNDLARQWMRVVLWLLAAWDTLSVIGIFASLNNNNVGGAVQPAVGLFVAAGGIVATIVGTILLQTVRLKKAAPKAIAQPMLSPDGHYWWDGASWRNLAESLPPGVPRSPDGHYWWDGASWRSLAESVPPGVPRSPDGQYWWDGASWRSIPLPR
jgi:hypothetical protein